jgi:hypothetical protein
MVPNNELNPSTVECFGLLQQIGCIVGDCQSIPTN